MPSFAFTARDRSGRSHRGTLHAVTPGAAANDLRQRGWLVVSVQADDTKSVGQQLAELNPLAYLPPRSVDIELGCRQLALMLRSGLTLLTALQLVARNANRATLRGAWQQIALRLQEGASLAQAMTETRRFARVIVQLVRVGEQTGALEQALDRAADALESRRRLRTSLLTALAYPTIVLVASIGVTGFMVLGVIPKLKAFLRALGRDLPAMTQWLLDFSDAAQRHLPRFCMTMAGFAVCGVLLYRHPPSRLIIDRLLLRVPVVGNLLRLAYTESLARTLGILVRSGITLIEGLRSSEDLMRNKFLARRVSLAREQVIQGGNLADPLSQPHAFAPMLGRMVSVGESSGTLDDVLDEVARFYESQLQAAIRTLGAVIEPAIIILVGGIVGFVYIAFFVALFSAGGM